MRKKWFFEKTLPGSRGIYKIGFLLKKKIFSKKSKFQKIEIFDTVGFGRILVLDGIVQLSQKHEFCYHEMISHLPLFYHPNPKSILIIGGGDGGVLREVLKHPVRKVFLVEIDEEILKISKKYFPFLKLKNSLEDERVNVFIENGLTFIKKFKNYFDVIISDSTDPSGPSRVLFGKNFYLYVKRALTNEGIFITQSGNFLDQFFEVKKSFHKLQEIFPLVKIHKSVIFDYQFTDFAFLVAFKKKSLAKFNLRLAKRRFERLKRKHPFKFYSPQIHLSSEILPLFYIERLWKK